MRILISDNTAVSCLFLTALLSFVFIQNSEAQAQQKFHEVENYSVKYKLEGSSVGEKMLYSRNWGNIVCMVEVSEISMPGAPVQKRNERVITKIEDGEQWIISINLDNNTGTKMKNPLYKSLAEQMGDKSPREFSEEFMKQMGGKVVGEDTVIGEKCTEWEMMGVAKACVTEDIITLRTTVNMAGTALSETAVEVKRNDPGPKEACDMGDAKITELDMGNMMGK